MKHNKKVLQPAVPAKEVEVHSHTSCDWCKEVIEKNYSYEVDEVEVYRDTGARYPSGGNGVKTYYDFCGKCWDRLVEQLREQGVNPSTEEWDY